MNLLEGKLLAEGQRIGVVAARFNEFITAKLVGGAKDAFVRHGGDENKLDLAWVPGAFEIPLVAKKMVESGKYDAVVCLGAVIRGATPHFDMVANEATKGVAHVGKDRIFITFFFCNLHDPLNEDHSVRLQFPEFFH